MSEFEYVQSLLDIIDKQNEIIRNQDTLLRMYEAQLNEDKENG